MATTIKLKNSVTTTNAPSSLVQGEVAINITDKKVWVGNAATTPIQLLGDGGSVNFTTVDTTNLQVTNIKAKDGTASASIANSTGAFTVAAAFAANGGATLGDASGDALTINSSAVSIPNGLNFDSNTLVIDATNNRVGVGTASPSQKLDVIGAGYFATAVSIRSTTIPSGYNLHVSQDDGDKALAKFTNTATGVTTTDGFDVGINISEQPILWNFENTAMLFATNNTERMRITSAGDVGIGTSSPTGKLTFGQTASGNTKINGDRTDAQFTITGGSGSSGGIIQLFGSTYTNYAGAIYLDAVSSTSGTNDSCIIFRNGTSATERMRIDSSGNVGIGTSSPAQRLHVASSSSTYIQVQNTGNSVNAYYGVDTAGGWMGTSTNHYAAFYTNNTERMRITSDGILLVGRTSSPGDGLARIAVASNSDTAIQITKNGVVATRLTAVNTALAFGVDGVDGATERMRITSGGDICVGKTVTADTTVGSVLFANGKIAGTRSESTNSSSTLDIYSTGAGAYRFYVGMGGTVYATSTTITAISDQRLKENIQDIDVGLDKVMALKPRKFDWKVGKGKDKKGDRGWIAQEFEQVFPEMIDTWKDPAPEGEEPYKSVNADLIPVLVKAIQEQQLMIEELKQEVALLKAK